jgi:hypothetical protein
MTSLLPYITAGLRFPNDEILCKGDRWQQGCATADGEAAYAIHTVDGRHYCGYHSPFDNKYGHCDNCGEKPALLAKSPDDDQICDDCLTAINQVTEYDHYLAMTGAHDLRHPNRPAPADLPVSNSVDYYTKAEIAPAVHVCNEAEERAAYSKYVSDGLADTDGYYAPEPFEAWRAHHHRAIGYKEPRTEECTETECKAPSHERLKCVQDRIPGKGRKFRTYSICHGCYDRRVTAYRAVRTA